MRMKWLKSKHDKKLDKADLVQTIIIIAGLAVAAIVAIGSISSIIMEKGENTAKCISNFSATNPYNTNFDNNCKTFTWELDRDTIAVRTYIIQFDELEEFEESKNNVIEDCKTIRKDNDYQIGTRVADMMYTCTIFEGEGIDSGTTPGTPTNFPFEKAVTQVLW